MDVREYSETGVRRRQAPRQHVWDCLRARANPMGSSPR